MDKMSKYFKPSVVALKPYSSARDEYHGQEGIFLDANENAFDFENNRYPDPYQSELKQAIGQWRQIDPDYIFLGNGSDEIIDLLIRSTCRPGIDRILSLDPSYGMYRVSSSINEVDLDLVEMKPDLTVDLPQLISQLNNSHKLVFVCSPNNPNGGIVNPEVIEELLSKCNGLVVVDEAYIDFSDSDSWIRKLDKYENLIVLQTFSKSLGAAGIRLGMAFMNSSLVDFLNKVKPPYNISNPNQEAAKDRLRSIEKVRTAIQETKVQRALVQKSMLQLALVEKVFPSSANFLLVKFSNVSLVFEQLKARKIIVRDRSREKYCNGCLRITIGTENQNQALMNALKEIDKQVTITI